MHKGRLALALVCSMFLSGCGGGYLLDTPVKRSAIVPDMGAVSTVEVGDPLFFSEVIATYEVIKFTPGQTVKLGPLNEYEFREPFFKGSVGKKSQYYCGTMYRVGLMETLPGCFTIETLNKKNIPFQLGRDSRVEPGNFRQELVYQGRVGNELRISYREFSGEMARPAFTQELTFDVNGGAVIGAKGARLEVLGATNTSIRYRVLQGFN